MAYTKYSLTPANNTAAPPDGAPEGMLPSAVNDTMRDMMAQIRDCGDGVRDGTYTMTAVKITGGTITGVTLTGNTFSSPVISGGTINNATIGATTATTGKFSTLTNSALTSGRITYAGASGLLQDDADFTFDGTNLGLSGTGSRFINLGSTSTNGQTAALQISAPNSDASANVYRIGTGLTADNEFTVYDVTSSQTVDKYIRGASGFRALNTNGTERMRIDSSGALCLNTTSVIDSGILQVAYASGVNNGIIFRTNGTGSQYAAIFNNGNGLVGSITTNASATAYNTSSDYRLKENIAPITNALATVAQLKPVTYNWKVDGTNGQGFIAHELAEVVPDCVTGEKDAIDKDGKPQYQGVDTSFLVATLTKAIQEQQALIESLTTRLTALENK